eukprot:Pgem_evm2s18740
MEMQSPSTPSLVTANDYEQGKVSFNLSDILSGSFSSPFDYKSFQKYCASRFSDEGLNFIRDYKAVIQVEKNSEYYYN